MKYLINLSFVFFIGIAIFSCKNSESQTENGEAEATEIEGSANSDEDSLPALTDAQYEAMATELCDCMKPLVDLQNKVNSLTPDEIRAMTDEIKEVSEESEKCVENLEATYGKIQGRKAEDKADEAFKKACPYIAGMVSD